MIRKERVFVVGHLGLGDLIITQGIVNVFARIFDEVVVPSRHHNVPSVRHMNINNPTVTVFGINNDQEMLAVAKQFDGEVVRLGSHNGTRLRKADTQVLRNGRLTRLGLEGVFYEDAHVDVKERYNWEPQVPENGLIPSTKEKEFCFIHDDYRRNYNIREDTIKLPILRNLMTTETIFHYLPLIKKAKEIHCFDSCFALMVDQLKHIEANLYIHRYLRPDSKAINPNYRKNWKIIH
jgi:hypothetical protein